MDKKPANGQIDDLGLMTVLAAVSRQLPAAGVDCILIGGFAVNYYGYTRNTLDLDFMIVARQFENVKRIMTRCGFINVARNRNVVFFNAPGSPLRVDFLFVDAATMRKLLAKAKTIQAHGLPIRVPELKDLIAMKVFSLSNDTARRMGKDLPDIAWLCVVNNLDLEADIQPLCDRFGTSNIYALIRAQVEAIRKP